MNNIIYKAEGFPVFQNVLYNTVEEAQNCTVGDIELVQDEDTGIVYNRLFDSKLMEYNADYSFDPSVSPAFRYFIASIKNIIEPHLGKEKLLEIGCGKGFFVEYLSSCGFDVVGMDPAYEGDNPKIKKKYYSKDSRKQFNAIIMRQVLEHFENPYEALKNIKEANNNQGLIYIEVPCFDYINDNCCFMDIFYEHVNYFRPIDFKNMFDNIIEMGHIFGGRYLYVIADLKTLKKPTKTDTFVLNENFFKQLETYKDFIINSSKQSIIWGCGPRAQILSFFLNKKFNLHINHFVDINPARSGKFLALITTNSKGGG